MTIVMKKWLGLAVFGLVACSGKDVNLGNGLGKTSSAITYTGGCTPDSCANQAAANVDCPTSATLQCVADPHAGRVGHQDDRQDSDSRRGQDENKRRERIAGDAIRNGLGL